MIVGVRSWSDGSPIDYENFNDGEPNSFEEKCIEMIHGTGYKWNDAFCTNTRPYICKVQKGEFNLSE